MATSVKLSSLFVHVYFVFAAVDGAIESRNTRFVIPYMNVFENDTTTTLIMSTSSLTSLTVEINVDGQMFQETVSYGIPATVLIPYEESGTEHDRKATVDSSGEVTLVAFIGESGSFLVLPEDALGIKYFLPVWDSISAKIAISTVSDSDTVIAVALPSTDGTIEHAETSYSSPQIITVTISANKTIYLYTTGDVAGTLIIASQPLAVVIAGVVTSSQNSTSIMAEMLLPFESWDTAFLVVTLGLNSSYDEMYGIVAGLSGATLEISCQNDSNSYVLESRHSIVLNNTEGTSCYMMSSEPVFVSQFTDSDNTSVSMHTVLGVFHWTNSYTISPPPGTLFNYITILAATTSTEGIVTSDRLLADVTWTPVTGSNYSYVNVQYNTNFLYVVNTNCSEQFGVYAYGYYGNENNQSSLSYGYPAGVRLFTDVVSNETSCENPVLDFLLSPTSSVPSEYFSESVPFESKSVNQTSLGITDTCITSVHEATGVSSSLAVSWDIPSTGSPSPQTVDSPSQSTESSATMLTDSLLVSLEPTYLSDIMSSTEYRRHLSDSQTVVTPLSSSHSMFNQGSPSVYSTPVALFPSSSIGAQEGSVVFTLTHPENSFQSSDLGSDEAPLISYQTSLEAEVSTISLVASFNDATSDIVERSASSISSSSEFSSEGLESLRLANTAVLYSDEVFPALYTFIGAGAAVVVFAGVVSLGLWVGITKCRSSAKFSLESGNTQTSTICRSTVKKIVVAPHDSPRPPPRVKHVNKQTTMTSLRSQQSLNF